MGDIDRHDEKLVQDRSYRKAGSIAKGGRVQEGKDID